MLMILLVRRLFRLARFAVLLALLWTLLGAVDRAAGPSVAHVRGFVAQVERVLGLDAPPRAPAGRADERLGVVTRTAGCRETAGLPDPRCTPGAVRRGISLAVICRPGYSRSVRPPVSFTEPLKLRQMRAYHLPGPPGAYEEDHLVALSLGGAPRDPANLWPEPRDTPHDASEKDALETWAARMACAHRLPLAELRRDMARDWVALYARAGGAHSLPRNARGGWRWTAARPTAPAQDRTPPGVRRGHGSVPQRAGPRTPRGGHRRCHPPPRPSSSRSCSSPPTSHRARR